MPYVVRPRRIPGSALVACSALLAFGAASAQASTASVVSTPPETQTCEEPLLVQPFLYAGDSSYYTLAPGQTPGNFNGVGWALSGGASIKQTTLQDGSTGYVLDMPHGSTAVSPSFCVTSAYPTARTLVRNVVGAGGVFFYVSYQGTATWNTPKNTGQLHGSGSAWTLSGSINMQPEKVSGWQIVRLTLTEPGGYGESQLYNLYIDPYRR
jgi:hypothetical protein